LSLSFYLLYLYITFARADFYILLKFTAGVSFDNTEIINPSIYTIEKTVIYSTANPESFFENRNFFQNALKPAHKFSTKLAKYVKVA